MIGVHDKLDDSMCWWDNEAIQNSVCDCKLCVDMLCSANTD